MSGVERHHHRIEVVAPERFRHGGAVVVAGDADETADFVIFELLDGGDDTVVAGHFVEIGAIAQAVDLDQVEVVGLQELETRVNRT